MSNTSTVSDIVRPLRRSARLNKAFPITVMGVDSYRGPYREEVSTITVSLHGCKYESKHDVLTNSWVRLELNNEENGGQPISARGLVKWVKRPQDTTGVYETAIELEEPGNIWGIDSPPEDWLAVPDSRPEQTNAPKPFAVPRSLPVARPAASEQRDRAFESISRETSSAASSVERPVGQMVGEFHQQMEKMLFEAAGAAVRERANSTLQEIRHGLEEEAKRILTVVASSQTSLWIDQSLKQLNKASLESVRNLHAAWTKRMEVDVRKAIERIEERSREFDTLAQSLSANALDRLQRGLDTSRAEGVERIVARLKDQSGPVIDHAKETMAELSRRRDEFEAALDQSFEKSSARIEDVCKRLETRFESAVQERLDASREELERTIQSFTSATLNQFTVSAQQQEAEAQARLREAVQPVAETTLSDLKAKAAETSRQFARELSAYSRNHLELVSGAISEVAKGLGKLPKE
ncbi:MAG: PilZ domain-containing protein [Candidatus Acidiferrales bacterium]